MLVVETPVFTRRICELLSDDEADLTPEQAKALGRLIREELK